MNPNDRLLELAPGTARRAWEVRKGEYADETVEHDVIEIHARRGLVFTVSTGVLTGSGHLQSVLANPANSGRSLYLYRMAAVLSGGSQSSLVFMRVIFNPETNGLTARSPGNARVGAGVSSVASLRAGVTSTAPTGGVVSDAGLPLVTNQRVTVDLPPLVLPPGVSMSFTTEIPKTVSASLTYWWYESVPLLS